jgi:hypothetical protein
MVIGLLRHRWRDGLSVSVEWSAAILAENGIVRVVCTTLRAEHKS